MCPKVFKTEKNAKRKKMQLNFHRSRKSNSYERKMEEIKLKLHELNEMGEEVKEGVCETA